MAQVAGVRLPQEVWDHIFSYLTTSDVINLCKTSNEYAHFLGEIPVVRQVKIAKFCPLFAYFVLFLVLKS